MDHPDCTASGAENAGSRPAGTEFEIETQRIAQIRKSLTILHRWKDSSYGEGFDVIVYADAVVSLHPTDVSLSKVIVFPSSTRVRAIYTAPVAKSNQASPSARAGGGASLSKTHDLKRPDAVLPPQSGAENLSTLRICLRNVSESDKVSDSDIVLSWIEQDKRGKTLENENLKRPHYAFIKALSHASDKCVVSHFKPKHLIEKAAPKNFDPSACMLLYREVDKVEDEAEEEDGPGVSRQISVTEGFAQQHAAAFDSFSNFELEARKSCLRRVMKCVLAAEHSKNPLLKVTDVHAAKGSAVLGVVQEAHSALESVCVSRRCDFTTLEEFEKYAEMLLVDLMCAAEEVIREAIGDLRISGVDYYSSQSNVEDFFCCDPLLVLMSDWYDHTSKVDDIQRSQGCAGFPVVRSAEICFVRQIQLMMFSIYEERLNLEISRIGLEEILARMAAHHLSFYHRDKMIERLMADENPHPSPQSKCKCMVGKYVKGEVSESKCKETAGKIADFVMLPEFTVRVTSLEACLYPQHLACCCRLMIDDLMKFLPEPDCAEAVYGADDLANFAAFLWECVIIPLLMTAGDESQCTRFFVKCFTSQMYGSIGENDSAERDYIINKIPEQAAIHSRATYNASNKLKFAEFEKKLISNDGGSLFVEFISTLDASELDHLCEPIIRVFGTGLDMENVLHKLIIKEVSLTQDEGTLFRRNSSATKLMTPFTWAVAKSYLVDTLGKIIRSIIDGPVMDLRAAAGGDVLQRQVQMLGETCLQIIESLYRTVRQMPLSVRRLVSALQASVEKSFPASKFIVSTGYLFLRVIVPCILQPDKFGMCHRALEDRDKRNLMLVGKVLQNLANASQFGDKEEHMRAMNPFLEKHQLLERLKAYMQILGNQEDFGHASHPEPTPVDEGHTIEDQMLLHQALLTKFQDTSHACMFRDLQPPPQHVSAAHSTATHPSELFYVKGRGAGVSPDDHFMTVLNMCSATMCNFYEPMRRFIIDGLAANSRAQAEIMFNAREIIQCNVTIRQTSFLSLFSGEARLVANVPTHVRFVTSEVAAGLFVAEQRPTEIVMPLVLAGSKLNLKLPNSIITKALPKDPPFYSGTQYSAFFPCDEKSLQTTVTLLKQKEGGQSFREIRTFQFGSSSSGDSSCTMEIQTADDEQMKFRVEVCFRNWLFQRFPAQDPPCTAFWYYQDDRHYVMHACLPETISHLEKNYAVFSSECRKIEGHKFSMPIPTSVGIQGIWMFEAVSLTPTYVMMQVNPVTRSRRRVIRTSFQSTHH